MATHTITTAIPRAAIAFELIQQRITETREHDGPAAAARLCDEKAGGLENIRDQADDPGSLMEFTLDLLGLDLNQLDDWAQALRRQSRQLRREIA
jgi:hypothetical protein